MNKKKNEIRIVDNTGRIVIPIKIRESLNINIDDDISFYVVGKKIILKKYKPVCIVCFKEKGNKIYREKLICDSCIKIAKNINENMFPR